MARWWFGNRADLHLVTAVSLPYPRSICSSVFPLVSGTRRHTNRNPITQTAEYSQKVPAAPSAAFRDGKVNVSRKQAIHSADTDTDTAAPRMRFGKISEMSTHVTGPKVIAKRSEEHTSELQSLRHL